MNKFVIILIILSTSLTTKVRSQFIFDRNNEIVPFSQILGYKSIIETENMHSLLLPTYDNDSLCKVYNNGKSLNEIGMSFIGSFNIDTLINIKESGINYSIKEGNIWIYSIESSNAPGVGVYLNISHLEKGSYLCFYGDTSAYFIKDTVIYTEENISNILKNDILFEKINGPKIIIEYFESNNVQKSNDIKVIKLEYEFVGLGKRSHYYK